MGKAKTPISYSRVSLIPIRDKLQNLFKICYGGSLFTIDLLLLEKAIRKLPLTHKKAIEIFFGLTGGINHSKRKMSEKDKSLQNMSSAAHNALFLLLGIDFVYIYDTTFTKLVDTVAKRIRNVGKELTNLDAVKYLILYFVYIKDGNKMHFNELESNSGSSA